MRVRVALMLCARKVHDFEQAPEVKNQGRLPQIRLQLFEVESAKNRGFSYHRRCNLC